MPQEKRRTIRRRARQIRKANKPKSTAKEYLQYSLVILIIIGILAAALVLTDSI